jgi:hypothetical protein
MKIETLIAIFCIIVSAELIAGLIGRKLVSGKILLTAVAIQVIPVPMYGWFRFMYPWEDFSSDSTHIAGLLLMSSPFEVFLVPVGVLMFLICVFYTVKTKLSPHCAMYVASEPAAGSRQVKANIGGETEYE